MDFRKKTIYQIYPKSFKDSNGDGVGDLQGVIQKLPYLADLGIDMIWFNPFFSSPQRDNGYDISDYYSIDPLYGTMADFDQLIAEMSAYGIEMMLDMVFNHTSTEHVWFQKALQGDKRYQDYYLIRPQKENGAPPTNWQSKFGGSAWSPFGESDTDCYLHLFDPTQADLNWRNPDVRQEMSRVVNFWIDKGVKGFRFDVINLIGKDDVLLDADDGIGKARYTDRPIVHDYLQELNRSSFGRINSVTVGEMSATTIENCLLYSHPERNELDMTFNFHHLKVDYEDGEKWSDIPFRFDELSGLLHEWGEKMADGNGWNALFWNNHDQPRAVSRFGNDTTYRNESATMLATAIHLSRGTPFIFQGEEIGLTNPYYSDLHSYRDVESINACHMLTEKGYSTKDCMQILQKKSRDNGRIPMPWNDGPNGGFSTSEPWIPLGKNWQTINVQSETEHGVIHPYYKQLIALRKELDIIAYGDYHAYTRNHEGIYAFTRTYGEEKLLVLTNFTDKKQRVALQPEWLNGSILIHNYPDRHALSADMILQPYEALAILVK